MKLELKHLTKRYGGHVALNDFSVTFGPGVYGILGANGAGKSTLMGLLSDNLKRDGGEILWDGADIVKLGKAFRKQLGFMPQQQGLYEHMTAQAFLCYIAQLKGIPKQEAEQEIETLLAVTNLSPVRHKKMGSFSGGMKQRVLLAQALLGQPGLLLLDEPTAGLDPRERIRIRNFISSVSRNRITLLATHIVSDIESISDQILLMKGGTLLGMGTPEQLLAPMACKVKELPCPPEQLPEVQSQYRVGNVFQRQGETWVRLIGDTLPDGGHFVQDRLTLEDVYLYYLGE